MAPVGQVYVVLMHGMRAITLAPVKATTTAASAAHKSQRGEGNGKVLKQFREQPNKNVRC